MPRRLLVRLAIVLLLELVGPPLKAAAADLRLRDYTHTTWTHYDGVPLGMISKTVQTSDGYLWIHTREVLLRFDGMRFVPASTPCTARITTMTRALDGGLWAICGEKLIRRTASGRFVEAAQITPTPAPAATLFADREGRLWILGQTIRYLPPDGSGVRKFASPSAAVFFIAAQDAAGTLWALDQSTNRLFHLYEDRAEFIMTLDGARCLTPARAGGVFAASQDQIWHLHRGMPPAAIARLPARGLNAVEGCMQEAEDGGLWVAARQNVLVLVRAGHVDTLPGTGPSERLVTNVFIDREGAIWVGATSGLHRFRKPTLQFAQLPIGSGMPWSVFADSHANLWTATGNSTHRSNLEDGTVRTLNGRYAAVGEDQTGSVWLSNEKAIGYVVNGTFVAVADDMGKPIANVFAFRQDHRGRLWALARGVGVYRVTPGPPRLTAASQRASVRFLVSERSGIWIGLAGGGIEQHVDDRIITRHSTVQPRTMVEDDGSIWVGSFDGLMRWRNDEWTAWTREQGLPADGSVKEIIADRSGYFWMMTGGGLLRVSRAQLEATPNGRPRPLSFARIGVLDGIVPHPGNLNQSPAATSDRAGRLYFTTMDAVVIVDPAAVSATSMTPPIILESVIVDNGSVDHATANNFVEPSRFQFEYTSLSVHSPELARFRYRLEGYDSDWIEAGARRQVTYGTLRPGAYRFRVIGAGSEGVWNETGASFDFHIVPVFWRTWWFQLSMVALGLSIVVGVYQLRIRQLTQQFNRGVEARVGERTRIARELHDTLLQTFQGVAIHVQAATNMLPARPDEAKQKFESVLDQAARAITEGRDAVQGLRESTATSEDLPNALSVLAAQLRDDTDPLSVVRIDVNVEGRPRSLQSLIRDDVYRIASEAMRNAVRHAQARQIQVDVQYDQQYLRLRIRDDGTGIDTATLEGQGISGHWGLPGMRERAELIGGTLDVRSRLKAGTEVELSLPASKAYAVAPSQRSFWARKHEGGGRR